ncbi:HAD family hydrolase [Gemmiger formicilis]|uniref:HAD family hydrolase n=1 Tax=Gemmiger formicilis TaxID=745368 RepID=UPI00195ECC56|nr:HAD family hydrolase [Gemmiger formicilis]MBM6716339.1 HAD family hydrolase [Gemmiger formicilis]
MKDLQHFTPAKAWLVCVDSDGCAMDTMDIKHFRCFGPCMVEEWNLQKWEKPILERWNEINLYSMTRGVNRFKGLAMALTEINRTYCPIEGVEELTEWVQSAPELSNRAVEQAAATAKGPCLAKALSWSQKVNAAINALPESEKNPFPGAAEGLEAAHAVADVAVVSSANREAVEEEWARCGLLDKVDVVCCQDTGSKADCIAALLGKGYAPDHVVMVGDAPGDKTAAEKNGVWFYPILVLHEAESWRELASEGLERFRQDDFAPYVETKGQQFEQNLQQ